MFVQIAALVVAAEVATALASETSSVNVPGVGEVVGNVLSDGTWTGKGIPFAAAPTGENRFRPPQPKQYNTSKLDATQFGPVCPQISSIGADLSQMDEDCLTLNIWSPPNRRKELLPVFFWIYGGAFQEGSSRDIDASTISKLGIVVVTSNYRLGPLGFFASDEIAKENPHAPGNGSVHSFLDQLEALQWVRKHIAAFGGDAEKITIGGQSAGSMSTCVHLHMPVSKDLFRRAILESDVCVSGAPWVDTTFHDGVKSQEMSKAFAASLNASDLASLRQMKIRDLLNSSQWGGFMPAPDGFYMSKLPSESPVVTRGIDIIVGGNTMDALGATPPLHGDAPIIPTTASALRSRASEYFGEEIYNLYEFPVEGSPEHDVKAVFFKMQGDVCMGCSKYWEAEKFVFAEENVFVYEFGYAAGEFKGLACHSCELYNTWNSTVPVPQIMQKAMLDSYNPELGDTMVRYWANFIKSGVPASNAAWPQYEGDIHTSGYLRISTSTSGQPQIEAARGLDAEKCDFYNTFRMASPTNAKKFSDFCNNPAPLPEFLI